MTSCKTTTLILVSIIMLSIVGCSGSEPGGGNPLSPEVTKSTTSHQNNRYLWGMYEISIDPEKETGEVMPVRGAAGHWNALSWLEKSPCTDCVEIVNIQHGMGQVAVEIRITHPFSNPNVTGFDVRGIAMFPGSKHFPVSDKYVPDMFGGDPELLSAAGYTALYAPWTSGSGPNGLQGYIKGKMSTVQVPDSTLNGFARFNSPGAANTRNAFYAGDSVNGDYLIQLGGPGSFVFGYAVDACWAPPTTKPVTDPMNDFPPEANCFEPWKVDFTADPNTYITDYGGLQTLYVRIFDHQGKSSHKEPKYECPDLFDGEMTGIFYADGADYTEYVIFIINTKHAAAGFYKCLIWVEDNENALSPDYLDLTAYYVVMITVEQDQGMARTWGGADSDAGYGVVVDGNGDFYVAGTFRGEPSTPIDFDPEQGELMVTSNGMADCFVSKFDYYGGLEWAKTWGGPGDDVAYCAALGPNNVIVAGYFNGAVDFDPGSGTDTHTSNGDRDCFVMSLDKYGSFQWAQTFGGGSADEVQEICVDGYNNIYVTGSFLDTVDFDPSGGVDEHSTAGVGSPGAFLCSYESGGNYSWTRAWCGDSASASAGTGVASTSLGLTYAAGYYRGTVDFDPSSGFSYQTSNGLDDAFVTYFDEDGAWLWAQSWGGTGIDKANDVAVDPLNRAYVVGEFEGEVDFDPGTGTKDLVSAGGSDAFLSAFSSDSSFLWATQWGLAEDDHATGVAVAWGLQELYVVGDTETTNLVDFFVSQFNLEGNNVWEDYFGGSDGYDYAYGVEVDSIGHAYATGSYQTAVDFDPTTGEETHESNGADDIFVEKVLYDGGW